MSVFQHHAHHAGSESSKQRAPSQAGSIASSENTSSTLTPPRSLHGQRMTRSVSSRSARSMKTGSESKRKPPSLNEEGWW